MSASVLNSDLHIRLNRMQTSSRYTSGEENILTKFYTKMYNFDKHKQAHSHVKCMSLKPILIPST